jgi:hypothetical protein
LKHCQERIPDISTRFAPLNLMAKWSELAILRNMLWYNAFRKSELGGSGAGWPGSAGSGFILEDIAHCNLDPDNAPKARAAQRSRAETVSVGRAWFS